MNLLVLANDKQKEELAGKHVFNELQLQWVTGPEAITGYPKADVCMDLLFENTEERIQWLRKLQINPVIINSVVTPLSETGEGFIRINGWNTFLKRPIIEAACDNDQLKERAEKIFSFLGKKTEWIPDAPGFITARVVACIINEAYFALQENVSSREEIDTAMKLGTNYPYGPFEWSEKIGLKKIHSLLDKLAKEQKRYEPAALLTKEAFA
jgi:3-hydroxybutyryl-CoA dehydrogenase